MIYTSFLLVLVCHKENPSIAWSYTCLHGYIPAPVYIFKSHCVCVCVYNFYLTIFRCKQEKSYFITSLTSFERNSDLVFISLNIMIKAPYPKQWNDLLEYVKGCFI